MLGRHLLSFLGAAAAALSSSAADAQEFESVDIGPEGSAGLAGSAVQTADGWTVSGAGNDIWGHWDEFHYLRFNHTGDVTVTAKVTSFGPTNLESWRKCGIMFRNKNADTNEQRLAHAMIQQTGWGVAMQHRPRDNSHSLSFHNSYDTSDVWLRLVKEGSTITSYVKRDGEYDFMRYTSVEVEFGPEFHIGFAVTAHTRSALATAEVTDWSISDGVYKMPAAATEVGDTGRAIWVQQVKEGIWSIQAGGDGIGGNADQFGFFDTPYSGDITAIFDLEKVLWNNNDSKGGLMIRASNATDAAHVSLLVKAGDGVTMVYREAAGGPTVTVPNVGVWRDNIQLRLVKTGNSVEASYKHKSAPSWYVLGTATAELDGAEPYRVGQAVTSSDRGQQGQLTGGVVQVTQA